MTQILLYLPSNNPDRPLFSFCPSLNFSKLLYGFYKFNLEVSLGHLDPPKPILQQKDCIPSYDLEKPMKPQTKSKVSDESTSETSGKHKSMHK